LGAAAIRPLARLRRAPVDQSYRWYQIVVEDDVEDPMEPVFDAPMGANGAREKSVVEWKVSVL
jgi:hypothetical protein